MKCGITTGNANVRGYLPAVFVKTAAPIMLMAFLLPYGFGEQGIWLAASVSDLAMLVVIILVLAAKAKSSGWGWGVVPKAPSP